MYGGRFKMRSEGFVSVVAEDHEGAKKKSGWKKIILQQNARDVSQSVIEKEEQKIN